MKGYDSYKVQTRTNIILVAFAIAVGLLILAPVVSALPAGFQEFYMPLPADQTQDIFLDIPNDQYDNIPESMHYVIGVTASADNTVLYYDHWENGLSQGPAGDEVVPLKKGQTIKFEGAPGDATANIPTRPRGTDTYYDGGDRIFVSGSLLQLVVSTWPMPTGTVFTDAWEVYPVQAWETSYTVPVGENLGNNYGGLGYDDFDKVWILVQSASDGNTILIKGPDGTTIDTVPLGRGQTYTKEVPTSGTTVTSSAPIQVQIIAGQPTSNYEMRGLTITPQQYWGTSYWAPAPSWPTRTVGRTTYTPDTDLFLFNPSSAEITVNWEDRSGAGGAIASGSFTIAAGGTRSYREATGHYVPQNSGAHLWSTTTFWGVGCCDTESSAWDWAYSLVPEQFLGTDNYLSWAPGTRDYSASGSPAFITGTQDGTTVYIDYNNDGTIDDTYTINKLQTIAVDDPNDNDNSGMHIVSTKPVAIVWGQDPQIAGTGDPYLDMGYTTLPLPIDWIDVALKVEKSASPDRILVGQQSTFTIDIKVPAEAGAPVTDIDLVDKLPAGWEYVSASPLPNSVAGDVATGQTLTWSTYDWDLNPGQTQTITITATATETVSTTAPSRNLGTATGTSMGASLTADDDAFVEVLPAGAAIEIKKQVKDAGGNWLDADVATGPALPSGTVAFRVIVTNIGNVALTGVTVTDPKYSGSPIAVGDLAIGASATHEFSLDWVAGQQSNTATATGTYSGIAVTDFDPAFYIGAQAEIHVEKVANKTIASVGETVKYTYTVTNLGNVPLFSVSVVDSVSGSTTYESGDDNENNQLEPTETWTFTDTYEVKEGDADPLVNIATATGYAYNVKFTDTATASVVIARPAIEIVKEGPASAAVGETITYQFTVTNTGNTDLTSVTVSDPLLGTEPISGPVSGDSGTAGVLEVGEAWTYTATYTVKVTDPNPLLNTARVTAEDPDGDPITDTGDESIPLSYAPAIEIVKSGPETAAVGETITYTFTVQHAATSDQSPIDNVVVTDPLPGLGTITLTGGDTDSDGVLKYGEIWTYTATYTVKVTDPNPLLNTATVTGVDTDGDTVTDTGDESIPLSYAPAIEIVKSGPETAAVGETITYTFTVQHAATSDQSPIDNVVVSDPLSGLSAISGPTGDTENDGVLTFGEVWTYTATYTVKVTDPNPLLNTATVHGQDLDDEDVTDTGDESIPLSYAPAIEIIKSGPESAAVGDTITYTFTVQHAATSDQSPIDNVVVTDPLTDLGAITGPTGDTENDGVLTYGEVWTYTASYTVKVTDPNPLLNTATVHGQDLDDEDVTDTGDESIPLSYAPAIEITKAGPDTAAVGETITYTFTVQHAATSDKSPIDNVVVSDPLPGLSALSGPTGDTDSDGILKYGEVWTYTATYTVKVTDPNPLLNTATVTGADTDGDTVTDTGDESIPLSYAPAIEIVKSGPETAAVGETITYTFTVQHAAGSDQSDITNVVVSDPLPGLSALSEPTGDTDDDGILKYGEVWTYTATYTVKVTDPNPLLNTATVNGKDLDGDDVTDTGDESIPLSYAPAIEITKAGPDTAAVGDTITYTFTVQHAAGSDQSPIDNVVVTDPLPGLGTITLTGGDTGSDGVLTYGEIWTYTATYTVKVTDPNPLLNTATVHGQDLDDEDVTDTGDESIPLSYSPAIEIVKSGPETAAVGETITYTFTVQHAATSDQSPIDNVVVTDPLPGLGTITLTGGDTGSDGVLTFGEVWTYTATYTVKVTDPNPLLNTATVHGQDLDDEDVTDTGDESIPLSYAPAIEIVKTGPASAAVGETITYTFTVQHAAGSDQSDITNVVVSDPLLGTEPISGPVSGDTGDDGILKYGEVWTYTATYTVKVTDPNPLLNTATVTAEDPDGDPVTDTGDESIPLSYAPAIEIVKSGPETAAVGETITYTFTVQHAAGSDQSDITNVVVSDPLLGTEPISGPVSGDTGNDGILKYGEAWTYTATYLVKVTDPNPLLNTATVTAEDPDGDTVTDTGDESIPLSYAPAIEIVKTGPAEAEVDETITYTFTVQHATGSDQSDITNVVVSDPLLGTEPISGPVSGDTGSDGVLKYGEVWTYTATYTVKATDASPLLNTATVHGKDLDGDALTPDSDDHSVDIITYAITVDKSGPETAEVGDEITYTFEVTNAGNVPITGVTLNDPLLGGAIPGPTPNPGDTDGDGALDVGETWTYTAKYTIKTTDPDPLPNEVTATGDYEGETCTDTDDHLVDTSIPARPAIQIVKTPDRATAEVGETVTYTFEVTNIGDVPLETVTVTDPLSGLSAITGPRPGEDANGDGKLDRTETWTYTATYLITTSSPDPVPNTAKATGYYGTASVDDTDDAIVDIVNHEIMVVKSGPETAEVGDEITYTFDVTNPGTVPLTDVTLTDPMLGGTIPAPVPNTGDIDGDNELDVGETWTYTAKYTIKETDPDPLPNTATATGHYGDATCTDTDDHSVDTSIPALPEISVTKTADPTSMPWPGGEFTYTVVVTNDGTIPVTLTSLTDSVYSGTMTGAALPVVIPVGGSEEYTFKVSHTEIGNYPNIVTAVARDARGNEDTATANALVTVDEPSLDAGIAIKKVTSDGTNEGDGLSIPEGTPITWKYYVTSTGTVPLSDVRVTDNRGVTPAYVSGDTDGDRLLDAGEEWLFTATGTAIAGSYTNTGTATATVSVAPPDWPPVTASDDSSYTGTATTPDYMSSTAGGYQGNGAPARALASNWNTLQPVTIGTTAGNSLTWTDVTALKKYLKTGGTGGALTKDASNPVTSTKNGGILGVQTATLTLNVRLSGLADGWPAGFGDLYYVNSGDSLNGKTVTEILAAANAALGDRTLPPGYTYSSLNELVTNLNEAFVDGVATPWAQNHLTPTYSGPGPSVPAITLDKVTADSKGKGDGLTFTEGTPITWIFTIMNAGNVPLTGITLSDDKLGPIALTDTDLKPGESMKVEVDGEAVEGPYANIGTVSGTSPTGTIVTASDGSSYTGVATPPTPAAAPELTMNKVTNDGTTEGDGLTIPEGTAITWKYTVENTGTVELTNIVVTDDKFSEPIGTIASLAPGASETLTKAGTAVAGPYANTGTATTTYGGATVTDSDTSSYTGAATAPALTLNKVTSDGKTEGDGLTIPEGTAITWKYTVRNTGTVELTNIVVTDDKFAEPIGTITTLAAGASKTLTKAGTAVAGPYANTGIATTIYGGATVTDSDTSSYTGTATPTVDFLTSAPSGFTGGGAPAKALKTSWNALNPVTIGTAAGNSLTWNKVNAAQKYLKTSDTPGPLAKDVTDPTASKNNGGTLGVQATALTLNIRMSGLATGWPAGFGALVYDGAADDALSGKTVAEILGAANTALGDKELPAGYTYSSLGSLLANLNQAYVGGTTTAWAQAHLG